MNQKHWSLRRYNEGIAIILNHPDVLKKQSNISKGTFIHTILEKASCRTKRLSDFIWTNHLEQNYN